MKKILKVGLLISFVILITGCGSEISCKKTFDDNIKYKVTVTGDVLNGNVVNAKAIMKFNNTKDAKEMCDFNKLIDNEKVVIVCTDKIVTINGYEYLEMDKNGTTISKEHFKNNLKKQGFKC